MSLPLQSKECMAIENELTAWQELGEFHSRDNALRCAAREGALAMLMIYSISLPFDVLGPPATLPTAGAVRSGAAATDFF